MVCLQETKLKSISKGIVISLSMGRNVDWVVSLSEGASRGILILLDTRVPNH